MDSSAKKWLVFIMCIFLLAALLLVARYESVRFATKMGMEPHKIYVSDASKPCLECHKRKGVAPNMITQWEGSKHAAKGIDCIQCHKAEKGDFDAFTCPESNILVAQFPTPKDCSKCHKEEVQEFTESKHAFPFWLYANADRAVFEPIIGTKHGCEQCHQITNFWPDGSVGECDACHPKHSFSIAVARTPATCGECHLGPDHPHIEIYNESKHGNIFNANQSKMDLNFKSSMDKPIPIEVPTCTTCHMDAAPGVKGTHNVSARLAWESQAPWSYRTVWMEEKLGDWKAKRKRMENVCINCHSQKFVSNYSLIADLTNLQYNEIRRQFVYWSKKYTKSGIVDRIELNGKFYSKDFISGWDEKPEHLMYNAWHHEGRRFRHGAEMMGPDYTNWHGLWELQHDMMEMIAYGAEHGDAEAQALVDSNSPTKFMTYKIYDIPGNDWGIGTEKNRTPVLYKIIPDYWEKVKANVEEAFNHGMLTKEQWDMWMERYNNKEHYMGTKYPPHPVFEAYKARNKKDLSELKKQAIGIKLPSPTPYEDIH